MKPDTMHELITAAQAGDSRALDTLLRDVVMPQARRVCLARFRQTSHHIGRDYADDVDDLVQATMRSAVDALPRFDVHGDASFIALVWAIAVNRVKDMRRHDARQRSIPVDGVPEPRDPSALPDEALERAESAAASRAMVQRLLAGLPPRWPAVLMLRLGHELSAAETAAMIGTTPAAVRVIQHRALAAVRRRLSGMDVAA